MLCHYRRYWAWFAAILIALPLLVGIAGSRGRTASSEEARLLAPLPVLPNSFWGWRNLPHQADAYLRDHFGLRQALLRAYVLIMSSNLEHAGNPLVLTGSKGWMFYRGDDMVRQSAGLLRRDQGLGEIEDLLATMRTLLAARHTKLLVAPPPNSATIYSDHLPVWARNSGQRTEYDVFLDGLGARGVHAVDLRPVLWTAKSQGNVYRRHDTHWTPRGALAAFDAIVVADGHPDWVLDPASALGPPTIVAGGDLARMLGIAGDVTESDQLLTLPTGKRDLLGPTNDEFTPYLASDDRAGPTIMIIGDSFTASFFAPMLLPHVGRVVWLHHKFCRFDWKWIDDFNPDEVWWMPTERYLVCPHGNHPAGMPQ